MKGRNSFRSFFVQWGWFFAFLFVALFWMSGSMKGKALQMAELEGRLANISHSIQRSLAEKEELIREKNSQSDPLWVELVLMKKLGLVPSGQKKVYFQLIDNSCN